ncbi:MAG: dephospho-CoA kinase [Intrasporangiaceae bacterium]|nr:dephospho-CoA kinase [Intrasporangiaceae bacterium]
MYLVGLTGGIGSGKSTVAERLAELGAEVIDADGIAREVVEPGGPALPGLVERFGDGILQPDGHLDRRALAAIAFADDRSRADLDRLTHPHVAGRIASRIAELGGQEGARSDAIVVVDHPLLIETQQTARFDAVVVVLASRDVRATRLCENRGLDRADVEARMRAQVDDAARRAVATHVIDNSGDLAGLHDEVDAVHEALRMAARAAAT